MQIRPETARDPNVAVARIDRVENNIHAGAKYLRHLIDDLLRRPRESRISTGCSWRSPPTMPARAGSPTCAGAPRGAASTRIAGSASVEIQAERDLGRETVAYVGNIVKYYTVYRGITEQEEARRAARSLIVAR